MVSEQDLSRRVAAVRRLPGRLAAAYDRHFDGGRQERMFLSSVSFFLAFGAARGVTHAIRDQIGPFHNFATRGGTHVHHAVFGILGLLGVGYLWDAELGTGPKHAGLSRATSLAYGAAAALTLDEFALWLDLKDVYWKRQGRASIDAVALFGGALSIAAWGGDFLREAGREIARLRRAHMPR